MRPRRRARPATAVRAALLSATLVGAGPGTTHDSYARELCLDPGHMWSFCHVYCDVPHVPYWIGYSTEGEPCMDYPWGAREVQSDGPNQGDRRGWGPGLLTLSASASYPFAHESPPFVTQELHLWLVEVGCGYGFSGMTIGVEGDVYIESYEPVAPGQHEWRPAPDSRSGTLHLSSFDCLGECVWHFPCRPHLIGTFHVSSLNREPGRLEPDTWANVKRRWWASGSGEEEARR